MNAPMVKSGGTPLRMRGRLEMDEDTLRQYAGPFDTGEMTYYLVTRIDLEEEDSTSIYGDLSVVSPTYASARTLISAAKSWGYGADLWAMTPVALIEMLCSNASAHVVQINETYKRVTEKVRKDVLRRLKIEANTCTGLLGFYMDRRMNGFGNSGWDFVKGAIGFERPSDVIEERRALANLIACFALAGYAEPEIGHHDNVDADDVDDLAKFFKYRFITKWISSFKLDGIKKRGSK
jgi:hypothetical protein